MNTSITHTKKQTIAGDPVHIKSPNAKHLAKKHFCKTSKQSGRNVQHKKVQITTTKDHRKRAALDLHIFTNSNLKKN